MKHPIFSRSSSGLFDDAISKLSPDVFLHPVWLRFAATTMAQSSDTAEDLLSVARNLEHADPGGACQVLLICAFFQNHSGRHEHALRSIQRAQVLAERNGFHRESMWAIWGACAISTQQGNYEQAGSNLVDLQAGLSKQNEWILANFTDVLRQFLFRPVAANDEKHSASAANDSFEDVLTLAFDWLQHWGYPDQVTETQFRVNLGKSLSQAARQAALTESFFSIQRWHTFLLAIRGELRLHWAELDGRGRARRLSFWGSFLSSLRLTLGGRKVEAEFIENNRQLPRLPGPPTLPPANEIPPPKARMRRKRSLETSESLKSVNRRARAATTVPVAVHMLGAFRMTIGDLTVRLPASRGLSLLKYLLRHHQHKIPREVLMDIFWPDVEPETARNNLNVTLHNLRKALRRVIFLPVIVFEDGAYGLEPNLEVWLDVEEFERCVKAGQMLEARDYLTAALTEYETATSLYQGDFLEENPYDEWTILDRERLRISYLDTLDRLSQMHFSHERYGACTTVCQLILRQDRCREDAHGLLMRCYSRQGRYHLALQQYHICADALRQELDLGPTQHMVQLYERIRHGESV